MASWIRDGDINQSKFYALHRNAPPGTIIKVTNRMNGDYVFVKVVGTLDPTLATMTSKFLKCRKPLQKELAQ